MRIWEQFEIEVLDAVGVGGSFTSETLAEDLGLDSTDASQWIQNYLQAQRGKNSSTRYVLNRTGRTRRAVWTVGGRTKDARRVVGQFGDDVKCTLRRGVIRDLIRHKKINPRSHTAIEDQLEPMLDGFVGMVEAMIASTGWSDDERASVRPGEG